MSLRISSASPLRALLALHLTGGAFFVSAVLLGRAVAGGFPSEIHWTVRSGAVVAVAGLALAGSVVEWARRVSQQDPAQQIGAGIVLVTLPVAVSVIALSAGASPAGLVFRTLFVGAATLAAVGVPLRRLAEEAIRELAGELVSNADTSVQPATKTNEIVPAEPAPFSLRPAHTIAEDELVQTWSRALRDGTEVIEAEVSARFAAGERQVLVHIPIQPVLASTPVVECEPVEAAAVDLHVDLATPFGVRIRATRSDDVKSPACVAVSVLMSAAASVCDAA